jgi:hypothetical protein
MQDDVLAQFGKRLAQVRKQKNQDSQKNEIRAINISQTWLSPIVVSNK